MNFIKCITTLISRIYQVIRGDLKIGKKDKGVIKWITTSSSALTSKCTHFVIDNISEKIINAISVYTAYIGIALLIRAGCCLLAKQTFQGFVDGLIQSAGILALHILIGAVAIFIATKKGKFAAPIYKSVIAGLFILMLCSLTVVVRNFFDITDFHNMGYQSYFLACASKNYILAMMCKQLMLNLSMGRQLYIKDENENEAEKPRLSLKELASGITDGIKNPKEMLNKVGQAIKNTDATWQEQDDEWSEQEDARPGEFGENISRTSMTGVTGVTGGRPEETVHRPMIITGDGKLAYMDTEELVVSSKANKNNQRNEIIDLEPVEENKEVYSDSDVPLQANKPKRRFNKKPKQFIEESTDENQDEFELEDIEDEPEDIEDLDETEDIEDFDEFEEFE